MVPSNTSRPLQPTVATSPSNVAGPPARAPERPVGLSRTQRDDDCREDHASEPGPPHMASKPQPRPRRPWLSPLACCAPTLRQTAYVEGVGHPAGL